MKIDFSGLKELEGKVIDVKGALSLKVEVENMEVENAAKVIGIKEGESIGVWLACLMVTKKDKIKESKKFLKRKALGKKVKIIPDSFKPNKQGKINGHVYLYEENSYLNKLILKKHLVERDEKQASPMCVELLKKGFRTR